MAQTKKRRATKHRGNAAGMIESRGRTGRKPAAGERSGGAKESAAERRERRANTPPTWGAAFNRALISTALFIAVVILLFHQDPLTSIGLGALVLVFYIPLGYYVDKFVYRRRIARRDAVRR